MTLAPEHSGLSEEPGPDVDAGTVGDDRVGRRVVEPVRREEFVAADVGLPRLQRPRVVVDVGVVDFPTGVGDVEPVAGDEERLERVRPRVVRLLLGGAVVPVRSLRNVTVSPDVSTRMVAS